MCESSHFFSGGQTAIAKGINAAQISRTGKFFNNTPEAVSGLVDTGLESPKDTLSYKLAEKASKKSGKLSNYEVGQLYNANVEQIAAEESEVQKITEETAENAVTEDVAHNDSLSKSAEINKLNAKSADNSPKTPDINNKTVLSVVEDTVFPQLKEDAIDLFEKEYGGKGLSGFADRLVENYKKTGDIGDNERNLFSDGGEAIKSFIAEKVKNERTTDTENISDRVFETVGARNVKAFQYTYPQFKKYYLPLAQELLGDIDSTVKGEKFVIYDSQNGNGHGIAEFSGTNRITSEAIARIKDSTKASYADIKDALNRIINDSGRENTALAKRIELVMDDMLTDGYTAFDGTKIPPNESYIAEKADVESDRTITDDMADNNTPANSSNEVSTATKITVDMDDDTRAELLKKKSINVVGFDVKKAKTLQKVDFNALQNEMKRYTSPIIKKIVEDFGILNKSYFNPDIELDFEYSRSSLNESIHKQHGISEDFVKMLSVFPNIIKNAVGIETHKDKYIGTIREDTTLKQMYVLASALSDENGIIPVKLEVKQFKDKENKLYLSVVLTKKEGWNLGGNLGQNQLNTAPPTLSITIPDLVGIVNPKEGEFLKYFPDSMLYNEQIEGKRKALSRDAEKIKGLMHNDKNNVPKSGNSTDNGGRQKRQLKDMSPQLQDMFRKRQEAAESVPTAETAAKATYSAEELKTGIKEQLANGVNTLDEITRNTGARVNDVNAALFEMSLNGDVTQKPGNVYELNSSASDTKEAGKSETTANTDKVVSAIQTTIKPEILSDEKLTSMLKKQFGDNGIYGLADKIISVNMENQSIKGFEHLFTDGGKAVREALKGTDKRKEKYALSNAPASNIYDYTKTFSDQLDDWKNGKIPPRDSLLVGATPDVLKRIGFNALPITINQKHIDYAINGSKDSDHTIGISVLRQLPKALENPVAVIESQSQPNRVVVIVDMKHNGKSVVMPIEVDGYGTQNSLLIDSNAIVSIYAKDNAVTKQLNGAIQNEQSGNTAVFYLNKNKAAALLQIAGLQLPGHLFRNNGYIHSILENSSNVNPKFKNVTYSQQFKRWFGDWESKKNTASKVVNKDGTPKIVYHGTSRGGFTVFDTYGSNYGLFGTGSYFTEDAEIAEQYTNKGKGQNKTVYSAYLNIRKPIDMDAAADIGLWSKAVNKYSDEIYVDFSNCKTNEDCFRAVEDAMEYEGFPKYEAYEFMREILNNDMGFDGITHIGGGRIQKDSKKHRVWIAFNPEQIKSATDNIGTFDPNKADIRYSTGKGGYSGHSMSNRAVRAYENGERPLSKWSKSELLNNIEDVCFDNDVTPPDFSKLTVSELRDNFLVRSSWHHTGALYNATNFYELDSDAVLKASPETIDDIISNRQRNILSEAERDEKKRGQIALQQAQETYRKIAFIFDAGISKYKRLSSLVEQYTKGKLDIESEYNKALDKRIEETSRKVEAWEKLPEGHWRKKSVSEFNDNAIEYVEKVYSRTDSNNGDIQKLKKNILSQNVNIENKDGEYSPKKNEERGRFADEQSRDDLLFGNSGREYNASAGEQAEKISGFKREIEGKAEAERRSYAKELVEKGFTEKVTNGIHQYNLIKPEAYNDDMKSIAEAAEKRGVKVGFFAGHAIRSFDGRRAFLIDGIKISDTEILLRYDGAQSPQMLSKHEEIHIDWNAPEIQKAKEIILNGLSEAEKQSLLSDGRYKEYLDLYEGDTDAVWEEFVADVFSGMNTYTADYADIVADYWYDGKAIDRYSPAEYNNITDAGGVNNSGNEYSLLNKGKSNRVAVPNKWRPDLSVKKLIALQNDIKNEIKSSKQYVTDGAKWIFTDIDGTDVFAIYSTEDFSEPTILYESKDKRAEIEKTYLLNLLEAVENESVDGKSSIIGEIFGGNWVRLRDSIRDSDKTVGRGSSYRDAGVLPRQSPRKPRKALENVIRNLLEIQRENRRTSGVVNDKDQGRYFLSTDNGNLRYC